MNMRNRVTICTLIIGIGLICPFTKVARGQQSDPVQPRTREALEAVVYIERLPDTVQTSHFDWGYHVTGFYGIDYRFTTAKGYFSEQLLQSNKQQPAQ
jgi:hypothetical protein